MASPAEPHELGEGPSSPPLQQIDEPPRAKVKHQKNDSIGKQTLSSRAELVNLESEELDERASGRRSPPFKHVVSATSDTDVTAVSAPKLVNSSQERQGSKKKHRRLKSSSDTAPSGSKTDTGTSSVVPSASPDLPSTSFTGPSRKKVERQRSDKVSTDNTLALKVIGDSSSKSSRPKSPRSASKPSKSSKPESIGEASSPPSQYSLGTESPDSITPRSTNGISAYDQRRHTISEAAGPLMLSSPLLSHMNPIFAPHTPLVGSKTANVSAPAPFLARVPEVASSTSTLPNRAPLPGSKQPPHLGSNQPPLSGSKQPPLPGSKQPPLPGSKQPPLPGSKAPVSSSLVANNSSPVTAVSSGPMPFASHPTARIHAQPAPSLAKLPAMGSKALLPAVGSSSEYGAADPLRVRSGSGMEFTLDHNLNLNSPPSSPSTPHAKLRLPSGPSSVLPPMLKFPGPPPSLPGSASFNTALPATPAPAVEVPAFEENGTPVEADPNALRIVFSNRGYTEFPKRIIDTNGVVSIIAGGNELSELPPTLALKTGLTRLDFPNNQFKEIPMVVFELPSLKHLDFSKNKISLLPAGITSVSSLTTLLLQGNRLKAFPNHLCVLNRLEQLDMGGNKVKTLPPQLGNMSSLTSLRLSQCELESLPIEIGRLSQLKQLELHHNGLSKLPAEMAALTSLQTLDLGYNLFSTTPVNLFYVDSLTDLNLEKNQIEKIDESILRLSKLTRLNVEYNQLHSLPAEISMLPVLSQLLIIGNPLTNIPLEHQQSGDAVLEHLRWLKLQSSWKRRKLVFVGEEFVGKTSLRMSLINSYSTKTTRRKRKNRGTQLQASATGGTSSPAEIADPVATDGIDIEDWEPLGTDEDGLEPIVFSTWDFAGQQIYHPTHQFFITNRSTYLIIFNLLDQRTSRIEYWLKTLKARTDGKCPVVIVGTHRDDKRCDGKYVDSMFASMRRKYSTRFPFVREYVAVSSKTGRGLDKLTEVLVDLARASRSFKNIPDSYAKLEKQILQIRTTANTMSISEFEGVAISAGVVKADVSSCVEFLHDVGLVLYFNDKTGGLSDLVILDPLWIVNLLSSIITLKHGFVKDGIMMANCLPQIWKEYPPSEYNWLLKLLDKFEIIFRISPSTNADPSQGVRDRWISMLMDDGQSQFEQAAGRRATLASLDLLVIPSMLPATPADSHLNELWNNHSEFESHVYGRRYIFQFLPLGFFSRLIVRSLHMAGLTPQYVWRDGMVIDSDNERALVVHSELDYLLDIVIKTKKRQRSPSVSFSSESAAKKIMAASFNVLRQLADCVETLLVSWFKLKPIVQVPCHHCLYEKLFESPETVPYYFPIEECMLAVREGKDSLTCHAERKSRKRSLTSIGTPNATKQKDSIGSVESSSLPSFLMPPLSAREMGQASGSSVALSVLELGEHHTCLMRDLCSDIAFSDVSDMTVNWEDLNVGEVIGEGSYAQLRTGSYNNEPVAVKVLKYQQSNGGSSEQMDLLSDSFRELQHETFVMKNLKNPFLVELKAICTLPLAMVVDYFPLGSLDRHLRDTSVTHPCLSWKYRVRLALNIAKGMDYLHSEDFIHRDLRSPNILIASRDEKIDIVAKVADFGLAVICAKELKGGDFNECWTAPEILAASAYNSKVDQYSFGIVMWELLELGHPFKEYEEEFGNLPRLDFFDAIIGGLRPSFPETCPQDYQKLVKSCWATDPEDRPSFGRIAETLEAMEPQAAQWDEGILTATSAPSTPSTIRAILRKKSKGSNLNMRLRQGSLMDITAPAASSEASSEDK